MMRFQNMSPDNGLPLSNGRRSNSGEDKGQKMLKPVLVVEEPPRFRSPSKTQQLNSSDSGGGGGCRGLPNPPPQLENDHHHQGHQQGVSRGVSVCNSPIRNGENILLQWGHRKRSRCWRTETSSSSSGVKLKGRSEAAKISRSVAEARTAPPPAQGGETAVDMLSFSDAAADRVTRPSPPPPHPSLYSYPASAATTSNCNGGSSKSCSKEKMSDPLPRRNSEARSTTTATATTTTGKRPPPPPAGEKQNRKNHLSAKEQGGSRLNVASSTLSLRQQAAVVATEDRHAGDAAPLCSGHLNGKIYNSFLRNNVSDNPEGGERVWPKICISLSRKEKEEDFLAMRGTKLPHRPKKRPKNVDRYLQYCYPGMWLSDLTKSRYEVKEKKCAKKQQQKKRGLKGMKGLESDSE